MLTEHYDPVVVEQEAQQFWEKQQSFKVSEDLGKEKFYCLSMLPYPSGSLHMGHMRVYSIGDLISRYQRMQGKNVLQPMGWDAFGLPAENAAIKKNIAPAKWTHENIDHMRQQLKRVGFGYDWRREVTTCEPDYYHWEQWLFVKLFQQGLAYKKNSMVNWDPVDQTVLANEQVVDGRGWRSGAIVERREISQWFLKITAYAEELLKDLDKLAGGWPEQVLTMQRNWIGRSEGVVIEFEVADQSTHLDVFTTRADTLMGVTYLAIAPQHPLAQKTAESNPAIKAFLEKCSHIKVSEEAIETIEKEGLYTGLTATHPITGKAIPIWVANFVLMEYGSGAVMSVPAHDQRDFEFAQKYNLPIEVVIESTDQAKWDYSKRAFTEKGILINSGNFNQLSSDDAIEKIISLLHQHEKGHKKINYRLRDWGVSRQRYWGAPIPIINCSSCGPVAVPENDLPVILPIDVQFEGVASPLKNIHDFYHTNCPQCHEPATRETDTFDTFVESSWYYLRYCSYDQDKAMLDDRARYWSPVDQYVGGIEHAVMHLLYARFFHKVLRDQGIINSDEPFTRLLTQGMVLKDGAKMSKSKGNVVDPEALITKYGADTVRTFMIFAAPPEMALEWSDTGVEGSHRFLKRIWALSHCHFEKIKKLNQLKKSETFKTVSLEGAPCHLLAVRRQVHEILRQALYDYERQQFNTVISACMKILNLISDLNVPEDDEAKNMPLRVLHEGLSILLRILSPVAPHICHVLWRSLNYGDNILNAKWPKIIPDALKAMTVEIVVQVNGKLRGKFSVPANAKQPELEGMILQDPHFANILANKTLLKTIVVPDKLINFVVS